MKDIKKTLKKIKPIRKETKRVFAESAVLVLLEDMNDNIKIIAEGLLETNESLAGTNEKLAETNEKLDRIEQRQNRMEQRQDETDQKIDFLRTDTEKNFQLVFSYLSRIDDELMEIRLEIKEIKKELKNKADLQALEKLEKRVASLERQQLIFMQKEKIKV